MEEGKAGGIEQGRACERASGNGGTSDVVARLTGAHTSRSLPTQHSVKSRWQTIAEAREVDDPRTAAVDSAEDAEASRRRVR